MTAMILSDKLAREIYDEAGKPTAPRVRLGRSTAPALGGQRLAA